MVVEALIRGALVLVSLALGVAIAASEEDPFFLLFGAVFAFVFWRFGRKRRRGRHADAAYGWDDDNDDGGWFGGLFDGDGDGGDGDGGGDGGGNGGGGGD